MPHGLALIGDVFGSSSERRIRRESEANALLAQSQQIGVAPLVKIEQIDLMEGSFGPFSPMVPAKVPLYVALMLKHSYLCEIETPEWLSTEYLKKAITREEESAEDLSEIEMYMFDNYEACLSSCELVESVSDIRVLVERLREIRMKKLLKGFEYIDTPIIGIKNITFFEFRKIKEYILPHLEIQKKLQKK